MVLVGTGANLAACKARVVFLLGSALCFFRWRHYYVTTTHDPPGVFSLVKNRSQPLFHMWQCKHLGHQVSASYQIWAGRLNPTVMHCSESSGRRRTCPVSISRLSARDARYSRCRRPYRCCMGPLLDQRLSRRTAMRNHLLRLVDPNQQYPR
jgi:hypothetical protein